jgi:hypothetical protein
LPRDAFLCRLIDHWERRYAIWQWTEGESERSIDAGNPISAEDFVLTLAGLAARRPAGVEDRVALRMRASQDRQSSGRGRSCTTAGNMPADLLVGTAELLQAVGDQPGLDPVPDDMLHQVPPLCSVSAHYCGSSSESYWEGRRGRWCEILVGWVSQHPQ